MGHAQPIPATPPSPAQFTVVPPATPSTTTPAKKGGLKLGAIASAPKKTGGKSYTEVTGVDPDLIDRILDAKQQEKTLKESTIPQLQDEILSIARPQIHSVANGSVDDSVSVIASGTSRNALITLSKRYKQVEIPEAGIAAIVGPEFESHFTVGTKLTIDFEKVPEDRQQQFIDAIITAATACECLPAITAKQIIVPVVGFHNSRRRILTPAENALLDSRLPLVCSIRAR